MERVLAATDDARLHRYRCAPFCLALYPSVLPNGRRQRRPLVSAHRQPDRCVDRSRTFVRVIAYLSRVSISSGCDEIKAAMGDRAMMQLRRAVIAPQFAACGRHENEA